MTGSDTLFSRRPLLWGRRAGSLSRVSRAPRSCAPRHLPGRWGLLGRGWPTRHRQVSGSDPLSRLRRLSPNPV